MLVRRWRSWVSEPNWGKLSSSASRTATAFATLFDNGPTEAAIETLLMVNPGYSSVSALLIDRHRAVHKVLRLKLAI